MRFLVLPRERRKRITSLALPIIGGMVSQNIINLVDTGMVGQLGDQALAGVGTGGFIVFMCIAMSMGLSSGVQAVVSRRMGEGRTDALASPLNGALLTAVIAGVCLSTLFGLAAPGLFELVNDDPDVMAAGVPYIEIRLLAITAVGVNFSFRGFWNGTDRPKVYLATLLTIQGSNVFLNWVLIFGKLGMPELGVEGAALGTTIALYIGSVCHIILGIRNARHEGFLRGMCTREELRTLLRLAVPSGVQQVFFAAGYTALFAIIGKVGMQEVAAANVLVNLMLTAILPSVGLGMAAATLVGQAMGRGDSEDAFRWAWDVVKLAVVGLSLLGAFLAAVPELVLGVFLQNPETVSIARGPLIVWAFIMGIDGAGIVLMQALIGVGAPKQAMQVTVVMQWLVFLPVAWLVGPVLGQGLMGIWIAQAIYRLIQCGLFAWKWDRRGWVSIQV
ncbi:MAG: MATE family efflux transporter [Myxococcota bacterium]|nr:MATE family efflux transporter [Myxococcota bacterium]